MDGNYTKSMAYRFKQADLVIYLDMPRWQCLLRALISQLCFLSKNKRDDIPSDCKERINITFYKWIWNYPKRSRDKALALIEHHEGPVFHLRSNTEICRFIELFKTLTGKKNDIHT